MSTTFSATWSSSMSAILSSSMSATLFTFVLATLSTSMSATTTTSYTTMTNSVAKFEQSKQKNEKWGKCVKNYGANLQKLWGNAPKTMGQICKGQVIHNQNKRLQARNLP